MSDSYLAQWIAKILGRPAVSIRDACRRLQTQGYIVLAAPRAVWKASTDVVREDARPPQTRTKPEPDHWTPQPWVHPIRQRILR